MELEFLDAQGAPLLVGPKGLAEQASEFRSSEAQDSIWMVKWADGRRAPIYGSIAGSPVRLVERDGIYLPPPDDPKARKRLATAWHIRFGAPAPSRAEPQREQSVGVVTLFQDEELLRPLRPSLLVASANLPASEMKEIIHALGILASSLSMYSWFTEVASAPPGAAARSTIERIAVHAEDAIELLNTLTANQHEIWATRHDRLAYKARPVSRDEALRRGRLAAYMAASPRPGARLVRSIETDATTPERARVEAMATVVMERLRFLRRELDVRRAAIDDGVAEAASDDAPALTLRDAGSRPSSANLKDLIGRIDQSLRMASAAFQGPVPRAAMPPATNRMLMERGFREVEAAWRSYLDGAGSQTAQLGDGVIRPDEISLAASPFLYERWTWMTVLEGLRRRGFTLEEQSVLVFQELTSQWLRHADPSGASRLVLDHHDANIRVTLDFDRDVPVGDNRWKARGRCVKEQTQSLRPDLWIEARTARRVVNAVLDAKYKVNGIDLDLEDVADGKYRETFLPEVSGIMHVARDSTSWDRFEDRTFTSGGGPHCLLSLCLRPASDVHATLTTFFRLLLGYHLRAFNVCWRCGVPGRELERNGATRRWSCLECGSYWRKSHCGSCINDPGVPLLKFGVESFHRVLGDGSVACPQCGSGYRDSAPTSGERYPWVDAADPRGGEFSYDQAAADFAYDYNRPPLDS